MAIPTLAGNGPRAQMTRGRNRNTMVNTASHQSLEKKLSPTRRASYGHQSKPNTQKTQHQRNESLQKLAKSAASAPASKPADVSAGTAALRGVGTTAMTGLAAILADNSKKVGGGSAGGQRNANVGRGLRSDGSVASNIQLGRQLAKQHGWTDSQWRALKTLWTRESGWRTDADNPTSSAYGIPQALTELHGLGKKYMNSPKRQIKWGLNYIAGRYGDPLSALRFWNRNNYY